MSETTDKVSESTNFLSANVVESGSVSFSTSDFTDSGVTIGSPGVEAYYATKSVTTNIDSGTIPFVSAWFNLTPQQPGESFIAMNLVVDFENPFTMNARAWFTLDETTNNSRNVIRINFYFLDIIADVSRGLTVYYRVTSANITESSGL